MMWWRRFIRLFWRLPDFQIAGGRYLRRWWIVPRNAGFNLYLHRIHSSDESRHLHDHPWWNVSVVLWGAYREHFHDGSSKDRRPFSIVVRSPLKLHRIELLRGPVTTLFLTGPRVRTWGFMTADGWLPFDVYEKRKLQRESDRGSLL